MPLAERMRPQSFDEMAGQHHLLSKKAPLRRIIESRNIPSLIFYGPPGTGKTTVADIIASYTGKLFKKLNATVATLSELKEILSETSSVFTSDGILLYIDEIQYFNKKQQQSLLEYVEDGRVTLICSTTENPFFYVYGALLSRSAVFEFKSVSPNDIIPVLKRGVSVLQSEREEPLSVPDEVLKIIAERAGGDVRKSINTLENICFAAPEDVTPELAYEFLKGAGQRYDRSGDEFYDSLSALQKSIRGSDPDAAIFYLARILENGGMMAACRRLTVIACEDVGLAYPNCISIVKSCVDSALYLGMPEARIPLSHAAVLMATLPKSNSAYMAYASAAADVRDGKGMSFPRCLQNVHADSYGESKDQGYKYPHDFPNHYVKQQYLPDDIKDKQYYFFGDNKTERSAMEYWKSIKKE